MDRDFWKQVDAVLDQVMDQPPDNREAFLAGVCNDNTELYAEVLSLVRAQSQASEFMEHPAMSLAAEAMAVDLTTTASLVGQEVSSYKIEKLLGAGGMGEVYLARDGKLNRPVALKILPRHFLGEPERLRRFQREARALTTLNHPNLVTIYEVGEANDLNFIAMEFVEGQTLSATRDKLNLKELLSIAGQVAEALAAAHTAGVVHRDIKPDNIMLRHDGHVKVLDFGLAKLNQAVSGGDAASTQLGVAIGTLAYMSPEQAAGELVDYRTDIWSLGVLLYELVTSQRPFNSETRQATINAILSSEPDAPSTIDPTLPSELDLTINKALEKDRELRYQTASDFRADIRRVLRAIDSSPSASTPRFLVLRRRRWTWPIVTFGLLAIGALIWIVTHQKAVGPDWSRATRLQLTTQPGTEYFPSLAPDGAQFVYARKENASFDLFLQRVGGTNVTLLTPNTPSHETEPAFSPSGDRIAFHSTREPAGIFVMEATGENVRPVVPNCHHPSWSPDGKELVCSTKGRDAPTTRNSVPSSLMVVDVNTGAQRVLIENDAMQPSWSPSGARIAFWFMPPNAGRSDIATIARAGGPIEVITTDASTNWNPVWSPDGKFLYFASDRSGNMSFWRVSIDEETGKVQGEAQAVSTPSTFSRHLNFSRNGKRMIYVQTDQQSNIQAIRFNAQSEKTSGEPFWITRGDRQVVRPELSPDNSRFVMRVHRRTQDDLVVVNRDGSGWRDLTNDKFFDRYPRWSPDGKMIAFTSDRGGRYEIWTMNADGTNLRQLSFDSPGDTSFPLWSPDGSQILFRRNLVNMIADPNKNWAEQKPRELPEPGNGERFVAWDWSPDGQKLIGAFVGQDVQIGYFSFETNQYEKVAPFEAYPMWLSDSNRFIFLNSNKAYVADIKTKRMREVFDRGDESISGLGISNDGELLYFTVSSSESDIWLLDLP